MDEAPVPRVRVGQTRRARGSRVEYTSLARPTPFDPLDYENIARSCAGELLKQPLHPVPPSQRFWGPGVYALYYLGDHPPYATIRSAPADARQPIYVGKSDPSGGRKGGRKRPRSLGEAFRSEIWGRLNEHAESIRSVPSLHIEDFQCRYLVVVPLWIRMVERLLIEQWKPVWNGALDGFGNHDPGRRRPQIISWWDAMHPGRPANLGWKVNFAYTRTTEEAERLLRAWLELPEEARPVVVEDEDTEGDGVPTAGPT